MKHEDFKNLKVHFQKIIKIACLGHICVQKVIKIAW